VEGDLDPPRPGFWLEALDLAQLGESERYCARGEVYVRFVKPEGRIWDIWLSLDCILVFYSA